MTRTRFRSSNNSVGPLERAARRAAIEKSKAAYIYLVCEHYTDLDTQMIYREFRPKRGVAWCENCSKWQQINTNKFMHQGDDRLF